MAKTKKDINKQAMFSKIMPSGDSAHTVAPNVKNMQPFDPYEDERDKKSAEVKAELERQHMTPEQIEAEKKAEEEKLRAEQEAKAPKTEAPDVEEIISTYSKDAKAAEDKENKESDKTEQAAPEKKADEKKAEEPPAPEPQPDTAVKVINIHERMVAKRIEGALKKFGCCSCTLCRNDAMAMALNTVSPKYIVTTEADVEALLKNEDPAEVTQAISKAILHVKANPRH
ncbi:MAG: late competence development ComFB family protein [Ruminococcus sp.]|nr:late competence development ComFB family protein [Ruminococcus sp.]